MGGEYWGLGAGRISQRIQFEDDSARRVEPAAQRRAVGERCPEECTGWVLGGLDTWVGFIDDDWLGTAAAAGRFIVAIVRAVSRSTPGTHRITDVATPWRSGTV